MALLNKSGAPSYLDSDSKKHQGVISAYSKYSQDPLWNSWLEDLRSGKLEGTGDYFFDQYKGKKTAASDATKAGDLAREAGQNSIRGRYGLLQEELGDDLWGRGFGRSGLMAEGLGSLAGRERMEMEGLESSIKSGEQNYKNTIAGLQFQEGDLAKSIADRKKGLKYSALGSGLGLVGNLATGALF